MQERKAPFISNIIQLKLTEEAYAAMQQADRPEGEDNKVRILGIPSVDGVFGEGEVLAVETPYQEAANSPLAEVQALARTVVVILGNSLTVPAFDELAGKLRGTGQVSSVNWPAARELMPAGGQAT